MQHKLQSYYNKIFSKSWRPVISNLTQLSVGWESEIYAFDLAYRSVGRRHQNPLILRMYPGKDAKEKSKREYEGMQKLYQARYPVPEVVHYEENEAVLGKPFMIMERIEGQMLWPIWFQQSEDQQSKYLTQFCSLLVQLHKMDWRAFSETNPSDPFYYVDKEMGRLRAAFDRFPVPGFEPVMDWLEVRRVRVPCETPAPIHWDFHPGNILLQRDGALIVIDWTQMSVSDPRFDLAWTMLLMGSHELPIWRFRILNEYEKISGTTIEELEFFDVFACAKRLYTVAASIKYGPENLGMRPEALETMAGQMGAFERVYDILKERTGLIVPEVERFLTDL